MKVRDGLTRTVPATARIVACRNEQRGSTESTPLAFPSAIHGGGKPRTRGSNEAFFGDEMNLAATQLRSGNIIKHDGDLFAIHSVTHRTPGNLRAFVQAKMRNLRTGAMIEHRFRSEDRVEQAHVDDQEMEFLYRDGDDYHFMNTESYEQIPLNKEILGDSALYLIPNIQIKVQMYEGRPVGIELPITVDLVVTETEPGLKGATVSNVTKPATLETGLVVQVPPFINAGEKIRVDTSEGKYLERAK
jgi:elongation factor P